MFKRSLESGLPGDNLGILLRGLKREDVRRGQVLAKPGTLKAFQKFQEKLYVLTEDEGGRKKPFVNNFKPQFFFRTANVTGTVILPSDVSMVMPGDNLSFTVELIDYCPLNIGLRFVFRESHSTIGAGVITSLIDD